MFKVAEAKAVWSVAVPGSVPGHNARALVAHDYQLPEIGDSDQHHELRFVAPVTCHQWEVVEVPS